MTSRTVQVDWDPVPPHQQNGVIIKYVIRAIPQETLSALVLNATSTSTMISNLHPSYNYSIEIAAVSTDVGPFSQASFVKTLDDGKYCQHDIHVVFNIICIYSAPTGPPTNIVAISNSSTSIQISWQPPTPELQNGLISSYYISITELETGRVIDFTVQSMALDYVVSNLHPFYVYNCSVAANTIELGPSDYYIIQTLQDGNL